MKNLKYLIYSLTILFIAIFARESFAQCNSATQPSCAPSLNIVDEKIIIRKRVIHHNSQDPAYANSPATMPVAQRQQNVSNLGTPNNARGFKQTFHNPRDGSIFPGGRCDRGGCNKDGSMFGGGCSIPKGKCYKACKGNCSSPMKGSCEQSCKSCFQCTRYAKGNLDLTNDQVEKAGYLKTYIVKPEDQIYEAIHKCKDLSSLELKYVDFRIKKDKKYTGFTNKLGNYRFRIFGCRRFDKTAVLNQGRIMQKDLQFINIFDDMMSDCYNIVKTPDDLCDVNNNKPIPQYVLTAEITDYFMNVCDEYNWEKSKKEDSRKGSSEMTVTWRLTDTTGTKVLWKGESTGYAELDEGEYNGEIVLVERAFADAVNSLRNLPGFDDQLAKKVSAEELARQRHELIELEKIANPAKCAYKEEIKLLEEGKPCGIKRVCYDVNTCTGEKTIVSSGVIEEKIEERIEISEDGGSRSTASITPEQREIDEKSGYTASGIGGFGEGKTETKTNSDIDENSGYTASGIGGFGDGKFESKDGKEIDENSGYVSSGSGALGLASASVAGHAGIDENSGFTSSGSGILIDGDTISIEVVDEIDERGGSFSSASASDAWVDIDLPKEETTEDQRTIVESSFASDKDSLCIIDRPPYDTLTPENLYKVRASVIKIRNADGKEGSGLIISDQFVMTSADITIKDKNSYELETINGTKYKASVFRVNPEKNVALLVLDGQTLYRPLSLNLDLPQVGQNSFLTLGLLDFNPASPEGKLDNKTTIISYRYGNNDTVDIVANTNLQKSTIGGVLIDKYGTISGMSNRDYKYNENDLFIPIADALKSVGLSICGKPFPTQKVEWYDRATTPIAKAIDNYVAPKAPEAMNKKDRK
ncbi:MAG: hypothetical protein ACK5N8_00865 [Alphaproteobacteria bacterium]